MPYIIETRAGVARRDMSLAESDLAVRDTRTAVATLFEAREAALNTVLAVERAVSDPRRVGQFSELDEQARTLPESGGTVGPLPDGTVIEVRHVSWVDFGADVRERFGYQGGGWRDIDAFNAAS